MSVLVIRHRNKKTLYMIAAVIVVALIIASSVFVYLEYFSEEAEVTEPEPEVEEIDDRISPLTRQGLILEINRIRHRGLLEEIMKRGLSWRKEPSIYYITNMDDQEFSSKDVAAAGGATGSGLFTTWDTMFSERKTNRDVEEEQETSVISISIMEQQKVGLLGLRTQDVELARLYLTYDYRTGRWEGDDFFNDSDGYGHYINDDVELWFRLYQTDYDHDGIPYWTEVNVLDTDPKVDDSQLDPDEDGIPTTWEWRWGYDPNTYDNHTTLDPDEDGLENIEEYMMEKWFADPFSQDIYIEVDGMEKGKLLDWEHVFWKESQQVVIERFAEHGINLYIDDGWPEGPVNRGGEILPFYETISQDSGMMLEFYRHHFADERKGIFRYLVIGYNAGFCHPSTYNNYDALAVGTSLRKLIFKRQAFTPRTQRLALAAGVMHELGHSLGIAPWTIGGNDNLSFVDSRQAKQDYLDEWGNYRSVMNYYYIWDKTLVDYSDGSHGYNDQNDWEVFDLTFFQNEARVIEDPGFELPGQEEI